MLFEQIEDIQDFKLVNEQFPHIGELLKTNWGHDLFINVMDRLMHDTRNGTRRGFPPDVGRALMRLTVLHDNTFRIKRMDVWAGAYTSDDGK